MPKLNKKEKILVISFSVLISIFLIERFIVSPFSDKLDSASITISAQEDKIARLYYMESQKKTIADALEKAKTYIVTEENEDGSFSTIMKKIEEFAKSTGIIILKMKPEKEEEEERIEYRVRRVTLSVEGYLNEIVGFLYKLENSDYPLNINRMDLKSKSRATNLLTADLEVHLVYFP